MKLRTQILIKGYIEKGRFEDALIVIDENIKEDPDNPYLNYYKARTLYSLERYSESIAPLKKAIYEDRTNNEIALLAAEIFTKLRYYSKAEEFFDYTLKIHPDNPEALSGYAYLKAVLGLFNDSQKLLKRALEKDSSNPRVQLAKQKIELLMNNKNKEANALNKIDTRYLGNKYDMINEGFKKLESSDSEAAREYFRGILDNNPDSQEIYSALENIVKFKELNPVYIFFKSWKWQFLFFIVNILPIVGLYKYGKMRESILWSFLYLLYLLLAMMINMIITKKTKKTEFN